MIALRSSLGALAVVCALNACSNKHENEAQAPLFISESFVVSHEDQGAVHQTSIGIKRSSLEKEFLLQGEIIRQPTVAMFSNLKSRIVMFKLSNGQLSMMEAPDGHSSSSSIPQNIVLARFKITKEENGFLYFDFSEGMSKIFLASDWYISDALGTDYKAENSWKTVDLLSAFIEKAEADENNNLVIRQIAQMRTGKKAAAGEDDEGGQNILTPVEVKYYLTPYRANEGFLPKESKGMVNVGFFEIAPRLVQTGGQKVFATRWDERKPIVYSISTNTPAEYVQAIKDGVLYWNKAFGKEVLKVQMAPEGVTAPDFRYNMVQWVDWADAGFAYADAQMDPRTGEIRHASVFLTSVFGFSAKNKARQILRKVVYETENPKHRTHLSLAGFEQKHLCDRSFPSDFAQSLGKVLDDIEIGKLDEGVLLKLSQDYVREAVAHEIGHTLGLRHNFAGSLASNIPNDKREETFRAYMMGQKAPEGVVTSSSIMDYQVFPEGVMSGDQTSSAEKAMEYDTKAIQHLYFNKPLTDMPLFCTDTHIAKFADCAIFDYGPSFFEFVKTNEQSTFENLAFGLMEIFVSAKSSKEGSSDLSKVLPNPVAFTLAAITARLKFLQYLGKDAQFLKAKGDNSTYLKSEINRLGGLSAFLRPSRTEGVTKAANLIEKLIDSDIYSRSEGVGGKYEFTAEEKLVMKNSSKDFFKVLPHAGAPAELALYKLAPYKFSNEHFGNELAEIFAQLAWESIKAANGTIVGEIQTPDRLKFRVEVPKFIFSNETRLGAASILNNRSDDILWGYKAKAALRKKFKEMVESPFKGFDFSTIAAEDLSDELTDWVLINRQILATLGTVPSVPQLE